MAAIQRSYYSFSLLPPPLRWEWISDIWENLKIREIRVIYVDGFSSKKKKDKGWELVSSYEELLL